MRKYTKIIIFIVTVLFNVAFLYLCGYGAQSQPHTLDAIEPFFGVIMLILLGLGEVSVIQQLYLKKKFRDYKRRLFDLKLWGQCVSLVLYYVTAIILVISVHYIYGVFYIAVVAMVLSVFWTTGSRTLWSKECTGTTEEDVIGYYLADMGKLYEVKRVMENEEVVEMFCQARGDRERTITIAKKNQKLDQ